MPDTLIETGAGRMALRFLFARRLRTLMTAMGVALGVGLFAALAILGVTLRAALADQQRAGFGTYDLNVVAVGRLMTEKEVQDVASLREVLATAAVLHIAPGSAEGAGVPLTTDYIGVGPMPKGEFAYALREGRYPSPGEFVARPAVVERLGLQIGDRISLPFKTGNHEVTLVGIRNPTGGDLGESPDALTFDLSWLQSQMDLSNSVGSVLIWSTGKVPKTVVADLILHRAPDVEPIVRTETDAAASGISVIGAWAIVMAMAALFAAYFLVAGSFHIAIHERLRELAMLRALGATPDQVMRLVLQEAALLGIVGSAGGLLAGAGVARIALSLASASLGVVSRSMVFPVLLLAAEGVGGVLLAIAASWGPARAAGQVRPLEAMRSDRQAQVQREGTGRIPGILWMLLGAVLIPSSLLLTGGEWGRALLATAGGLAFVMGLIMALPRMLPVITGGLAAPLRQLFPMEALIAARSVTRHGRRSAMTLTTLLIGVMLVSSFGTLIVELTTNDQHEKQRRIPTDAMITTSSSTDLGTELAGKVAALPGVTLTVPVGKGIGGILAFRDWTTADQTWMADLAQKGGPADAYKRVAVVPVDMALYTKIIDHGAIQGDPSKGATLSVEAARRRGIRLGDTLQFVTYAQGAEAAQGKSVTPTPLVVTALVGHWMGLPENTIVVPRSTLHSPDLTIYLNYDPGRRKETISGIRQLLNAPSFGMASFLDLTDELEESHRQQVQVWSVLGAVAIVILIVATISLANAIIAGLQVRRRELATIRAVGSTPVQTATQVTLESVLLGLGGSLLGLAASAVFLVAAFIGLDSWPHTFAPMIYLGCLGFGPLLGALAALLPAASVSRGPVSAVLRTE